MAGWIDQSVPQAPQSPEQRAYLEYLFGTDGPDGNDRDEVRRKSALVEQLRGYGGEVTPQIRGKYAPQGIEYASVLGSRLASMSGQADARNAQTRALEDLRRKLYPSGGTGPADPSFQGVGAAPY
jgi:hypothetical protein